MKITKYIVAFCIATSITACTSSDDDLTDVEKEIEELTGSGNVSIEFDNAYLTSDLILNTTPYNGNETEKINISKVKYIVSNIRLEDENGTVFTHPKNESYFIVNEEDSDSQFMNLENVPAGNYTKITFGIGVDQEKYLQGAEGQGEFLAKAQEAGMMWSWQAGYKFFVFEGIYSSENTTEETAFAFHMGSHGSAIDNYKEVTLQLPNTARVRANATPEIHIIANVANVLKGTTKFMLDDAAQIHLDAVKSPQIATNVNGMFSVHHIHN